jgi:uncharacterized delta-60 repeat protein
VKKILIIELVLLFLLTGCGSGLCPLRSATGGCLSQAGNFQLQGILDPSFGGSGYVSTTFADITAINDLIMNSDGSIIAVGHYSSAFSGRHAIAKYLSNGSLDASFGTAGKVTQNFSGDDDSYMILRLTSGSFIVSGGYGGLNFATVKYYANGSVDTTFGTAGRVTTDMGGSDRDYDAVEQSSGKIVVVGMANSDFGLARYHANGSLDTTFGAAGTRLTNISGFDYATSVVEQSNGKLVVGGTTNSADFAVVRYSSDGTVDTTFGTAGVTTIDFSAATDSVRNIIALPDDSILLAGTTDSGSAARFAVSKVTSSGILDTTFGISGKVTVTFGGTWEWLGSMDVNSSGKIVLGGYTDVNGNDDAALVQLLPNGTVDTSFGTAGKIVNNWPATRDCVYVVKYQSDGRLLAAGETDLLTPSSRNFLILKYK